MPFTLLDQLTDLFDAYISSCSEIYEKYVAYKFAKFAWKMKVKLLDLTFSNASQSIAHHQCANASNQCVGVFCEKNVLKNFDNELINVT